jgi:hypothetical protein
MDATKMVMISNQPSEKRPFDIQDRLPKTCEEFLAR